MISAIISTIYSIVEIVVFFAVISFVLGFLTFGISKEDQELIKKLEGEGGD